MAKPLTLMVSRAVHEEMKSDLEKLESERERLLQRVVDLTQRVTAAEAALAESNRARARDLSPAAPLAKRRNKRQS